MGAGKRAAAVGKPNGKVLTAVRPNAGLEYLYRKRLDCLIDAMHRSFMKWVLAAYRANQPHIVEMAADKLPADELREVMRELGKRWRDRFDDGSKLLAGYFAKAASKRTDAQLQAILKKIGFSVDFKMTRAQRDIVAATVNENVALIKSIPDQYIKGVEGAVMRAVQVGNDVGGLAEELENTFGVTKRRAQFISRDQNAKATAALNRARQLELGIQFAEWQHSGAGRHPRPSHVKAGRDRVRFDVAKGWLDPALGRYIQPGSEPNCRCVSRSILPFAP